MKHISILVLKDAVLSSIDAAKQIFTRVNDFCLYQGKPPMFRVQLIGVEGETSFEKGAYSIRSDELIANIRETDLIIIPMVCGNFKTIVEANAAFVPWIIRLYKNNAEIGCLCVGSFLLASTGLLDGKTCAVHWAAANEFRAMFPAVKVGNDKVITYEQGIYTSGGSFSYLNLILHLIERHAGREMSILAAKMFEIDIDRKSQGSFVIFMGQKNHADEPVKRAQEFIENNYSDKITIEQLTTMVSLSRRNFERRFKKATLNTVIEYIQRVRIEVAKKGLESSRKTIIDLMYDVGYSDTKAFRTTFKKVTGLSPIEYRNKYCMDSPA